MEWKSWIRVACSSITLLLARYISLWFIVGSFHLFFSGITLFGPLAGLYMTPGFLALWFIPSFVHAMYYTLTFSLQLLSVYHIPTQLAAWYWRVLEVKNIETYRSKYHYICAGVPLFCMVLFMWHPVGWKAAPYSFYWIIPVCIAVLPTKNRWLCALGSTFTAHAVGSVLWIWLHPEMSSALWIELIPVVAYERFALATSMWAISYILDIFTEALVKVAMKTKLRTMQLGGTLTGEVMP